MNIKLLTIIFTVVLGGCAIGPTKNDAKNYQYSEPPEKSYVSAMIGVYLNKTLIDPDSAKLQCVALGNGAAFDCDSSAGRSCGNYYGHIVQCSVNAKNKFGGYTGAENLFFMFQKSPSSFWRIDATQSIVLAN